MQQKNTFAQPRLVKLSVWCYYSVRFYLSIWRPPFLPAGMPLLLCLFVCLLSCHCSSILLSVCLSIYLAISFCLSNRHCLSILSSKRQSFVLRRPSIRLHSVHTSFHLSMHPSLHPLSVHMSVRPTFSQPICPSCQPVFLFTCLGDVAVCDVGLYEQFPAR
jgi:hypothetical protein